MAAINVISVVPDTNQPVEFGAPFAFTIEYECLYALREDLEWKMIYVGSAESEEHDQVLDCVAVGPVLAGGYKFTFEGDAPDASKIPADDLIGVTVVLLTCYYKGAEFIRIGYYVNVDYGDEGLKENPPDVPVLDQLTRTILTDHPRVTRFPIEFDNDVAVPMAGEGQPIGMEEEEGMDAMQDDEGMGMGMGEEEQEGGYAGGEEEQQPGMQSNNMQQRQQLPMDAGMVF
ncbi:hypothetical protein FOA52_013148 [Chlamydomonas sp. UWO 241]|nr:hypothetical protein FOA52_013148 [Chlamydomonas sp. UWO 241]